MQSTTLALYASKVFLKPPIRNPNHTQISASSSSIQLDSHAVHRLSWQNLSSIFPPPSSSSLLFDAQISAPLIVSSRRYDNLVVRAALVPDSTGDATIPSELAKTLQLGSMFFIWYLLNIYFNIFNKQVLEVYPFPATVTAFQFGCATLIISLMWTLNLYARPKITRSQLAAILPLVVAHTMGNLLTNISLGKVSVSFTHTIKAMEPFFSVLLSALFLAERPNLWIVSSLVPIVGGVALASFTEASFNWIGFCCAMASNLTNQSRNVLSKKLMVKKEETLDNINLFSVITVISFFLLVPSAILIEGIKFSPSYLKSAVSIIFIHSLKLLFDVVKINQHRARTFQANQGLNIRELCMRLLLAGVCFHSYQQVSYMILQSVSPVTHAVGNCVKRVVVIVSSVIFFQTPVLPINSLGTAVALAGVFLYSRTKRVKPKPKVA